MVMVMKNNMLPHKVFKLIKLVKRNNIFLHFFSLELKLCLFIIFLKKLHIRKCKNLRENYIYIVYN